MLLCFICFFYCLCPCDVWAMDAFNNARPFMFNAFHVLQFLNIWMCNVLPSMFCSCLHTLYIKALWHSSLIYDGHLLYWTPATLLLLDTWIVCMLKNMQSWYELVRRKLFWVLINLLAPSDDFACRSTLDLVTKPCLLVHAVIRFRCRSITINTNWSEGVNILSGWGVVTFLH